MTIRNCPSESLHLINYLTWGSPSSLLDFIKIERNIGKKTIINYKEMQPGDVAATGLYKKTRSLDRL